MVIIYFLYVGLILGIKVFLKKNPWIFPVKGISFFIKFAHPFKWTKCIEMLKETYLPLMLFSLINLIHIGREDHSLNTWFKFYNLLFSLFIVIFYNGIALYLVFVSIV